jgi:hypothetical protein
MVLSEKNISLTRNKEMILESHCAVNYGMMHTVKKMTNNDVSLAMTIDFVSS